MAEAQGSRPSLLRGLGRNVVVLGLVSLLTDISSEMLYPVVPLFVTLVLGAPMTAVGLIEGVAECTANLLKVGSGWWSDRIGRRQPFMLAGYGLSALSKPLLALAVTWPGVLASRLLDRLGKGVRTSARDAMIAASCDPEHRGKAFGLHRAMDTVGAVFGPIAALLLLNHFHRHGLPDSASYRRVFLLALIPAVAGIAALLFVKEARSRENSALSAHPQPGPPISRDLWKFVAVFGVFALGNSSDVFLLLRAKAAFLAARPGHPDLARNLMLVVYIFYNLVYALAASPAGWLSDRLGRRRVIVAGFGVFALVYLGFAFSPGGAAIWALFGLYGLYGATTEGIAKAQVADLAPPESRATAMGLLYTVTGLMALVASVMAGVLWAHVGSYAPFVYGAACAGAAGVLYLAMGRLQGEPDQPEGQEMGRQ